MNDFFDKLSAAARRTADTVSAEFNVAAEEQKIRESYQALGKLYFRANGRAGRPAARILPTTAAGSRPACAASGS